MIQRGFIFDSNRCTGCNACQLACTLENQLAFTVSWRQIVSFNPDHLPGHPTFHLSLACNHCSNPDCLKYCPALAYYKDPLSGHVLLNSDHCIGCKYCSWVCPYDAPVYDPVSGLMTKCTFCDQRYREGRDPACIALCPTGALKSDLLDTKNNTFEIAGFPLSNMKPAINIIPFRRGGEPPGEISSSFDPELIDRYRKTLNSSTQKISLRSEWTLMVFTLLSAILVGDAVAEIFKNGFLPPLLYICLLAVTFGISLLHLGRKMRAFRAILNSRRSWLSREILFFSIFALLISVKLMGGNNSFYLELAAAFFGIYALYAMDQVYRILPGRDKGKWHSASVLLTALLWVSVISGYDIGWVILLTIKAWLFFRYHFSLSSPRSSPVFNMLIIIRMVAGFIILPLGIYFTVLSGIISILTLMIAEITDRILFYLGLCVTSPAEKMIRDLDTVIRP